VDGDWWVLHRIQGEKKVQKAQPKVEIIKNSKSSKVGGVGGGKKKCKDTCLKKYKDINFF
jgi:hypothetical protein